MGLNAQPSGERVHIGFFGLRNAGKSSVVNRCDRTEHCPLFPMSRAPPPTRCRRRWSCSLSARWLSSTRRALMMRARSVSERVARGALRRCWIKTDIAVLVIGQHASVCSLPSRNCIAVAFEQAGDSVCHRAQQRRTSTSVPCRHAGKRDLRQRSSRRATSRELKELIARAVKPTGAGQNVMVG